MTSKLSLSTARLERELNTLYHHKHDDTPQFTRHQMMIAICHGIHLGDSHLRRQPPQVPAEFITLILHGDDEHRTWLREAAEAYNLCLPPPPARGKGTYPVKRIPDAVMQGIGTVLLATYIFGSIILHVF